MNILNELILIGVLVLIGLPLLNYNFRIIFVILIGYLIIFPERRNMIYMIIKKNINNTESIGPFKDSSLNPSSNKYNKLCNEGDQLLKELKKYKRDESNVYLSIKISWKKFKKISNLLLSDTNITYPHHMFTTLIDQRKYILNQMSAMIVDMEALNLKESTLTKDRTLPLDVGLRVIIRKMDIVLNYILNIIKNKINSDWVEKPYNEISPVEWGEPQAYNQNKLDIII
jgi:hypothetical protein